MSEYPEMIHHIVVSNDYEICWTVAVLTSVVLSRGDCNEVAFRERPSAPLEDKHSLRSWTKLKSRKSQCCRLHSRWVQTGVGLARGLAKIDVAEPGTLDNPNIGLFANIEISAFLSGRFLAIFGHFLSVLAKQPRPDVIFVRSRETASKNRKIF